MKQTEEAATIEVAQARMSHDSGELPPLPSADQRFFDQSLRAGVRSMGEILRKRRERQ